MASCRASVSSAGCASGFVARYQASWLLPFTIHLRYVASSSRDMLWVISMMGQAISRNTHLLSLNLNYTTAGPCTPMCLYETTSSVTAAVVSGLSIESLGVATNKHEDRTTPVEPRISGEVGHAVAGMKRSDANELVKNLLSKYEPKLASAPLGKGLYECWDAEKRAPSKTYRALIKRYKKDMSALGLELKPEL